MLKGLCRLSSRLVCCWVFIACSLCGRAGRGEHHGLNGCYSTVSTVPMIMYRYQAGGRRTRTIVKAELFSTKTFDCVKHVASDWLVAIQGKYAQIRAEDENFEFWVLKNTRDTTSINQYTTYQNIFMTYLMMIDWWLFRLEVFMLWD